MLRVLLAERLPLMRGLLADILRALPEVTILAEATTAGDVVPSARLYAPDLVLLDWSLGGLEALQALRALRPAPAVIVMVSGRDSAYCAAVLAHGGAACLCREYLNREVPLAVQKIFFGTQ